VANELRIGVGGKTIKNLYQRLERAYSRQTAPYRHRKIDGVTRTLPDWD